MSTNTKSEGRCETPCDHVLCNPVTPPARTAPISLPPSTGWRDRLDTGEIRTARRARMEAQARGYGVMRDPIISAERLEQIPDPTPYGDEVRLDRAAGVEALHTAMTEHYGNGADVTR